TQPTGPAPTVPLPPPTQPAAPPSGPPPGGFTPPPPPGAPGPFAAPPEQPRSRRGVWFLLAALAVVAAVVGTVVVLGGGDEAAAGEIVLEPVGFSIATDFAGDLDLDTPGESLAIALGDVPPMGAGIAAALAGREIVGDEPGLYGGSLDTAVCDVDQLIQFLTDDDNRDKAEAWAEVQGIDVDDIEDFIRTLTSVRLRFDTRVTNNGFEDGEATAFQAVLEAGTAVLVDDRGVPRVKCNCGNPLAEPAPLGDVVEDDAFRVDDLAQNPDDAWDGFDPENVVVVDEGDEVDVFILVDIDTGDLFGRPVGTNGDDDTDIEDTDDLCEVFGDSPTCEGEGTTTTTEPDDTTTTTIELGTGDVQVTLEWDSPADLDLAVTEPGGERISFGNRGPTATGGQLDRDSNVGCVDNGSVENVFWPEGQAPSGPYLVEVTGFDVSCGSGAFTLTIRVSGQAEQVFDGVVGEDQTTTFDFTVG
ncbi:MAG: DUF6777 domain-containing protein, partial [Acidimicrobiales bacterium]